jgi:hypothetical protein
VVAWPEAFRRASYAVTEGRTTSLQRSRPYELPVGYFDVSILWMLQSRNTARTISAAETMIVPPMIVETAQRVTTRCC